MKSTYNIICFYIKILRYLLKGDCNAAVTIFIGQIILGLIPSIQVFLLKEIIEVLSNEMNSFIPNFISGTSFQPLLLFMLLLFGGLQICNNAIKSIIPCKQEKLKFHNDEVITKKVLQMIAMVPLQLMDESEFHNRARRAQQGASNFADFYVQALNVLSATITLLSLLGFLACIHWLLSFLILFLLIPYIRFNIKSVEKQNELYTRRTEQQRKVDYVSGLISKREAIKEIRLFQISDYIISSWKSLNRKDNDEHLTFEKKQTQSRTIMDFMLIIGFSISQGFLFLAFGFGKLTIGLTVSLINAFQQLRAATISWAMGFYRASLTYVSVKSTIEFLDYENNTNDTNNVTNKVFPATLTRGLTCSEVCFTYYGQTKPSLFSVNLHIYPGEVIALIGENGSGKSTLAKILLGLYEPTYGSVYYDGVEQRQFNKEDLYSNMSAVFQDFVKYETTVRENVGFGWLPSIEDDVLIKAAINSSGATEVIDRLPFGIDTVLGKTIGGGYELSGGEWQKLVCGRALMRQSALLVLDEPTASLDPKAEMEMLSQFMKLVKGRTTIIISHRIGCARLADRIVVLDKGRIVEQGTHQQLLEDNGKYRELLSLQSQWYA